ncbi:MAG TPA: dicarboxylate/amino acid:cation symporter [Chthoniobacterales bacterium]|jgi:aerobic C4-dicarboxylate transport protein|nr:dicarboxylate/amino acid:cation symporter [Chthoniobacterales bacterium]
MQISSSRRPWYRILYVQVLIAVFIGIVVGYVNPDLGKNLKPLGDGFVNLVKMIIAPIIFCTVVHGIASMSDIKKLGRVGLKAIVYFEIVSTLALFIGLIVVNTLQPGAGFNVDPKSLRGTALQQSQSFVQKAHSLNPVEFLLNIIPSSFFNSLASGDILQVLLVAILSGFAISFMGEQGLPILRAVDLAANVFFGVMRIIVKVAPIGAFGAMAFTVGSQGLGALKNLGYLMVCFYVTAGLFVIVVLGAIASFNGFSILRYLSYIKEELLLVLGTSSSEAALPGMLRKMRALGCSSSTVGLVIPTGYSFNLDGTNIYMTMASVFLAQATNTHLDLGQQLTILVVAMLSSKGATGVTGAGFITLAATLSVIPSVPIESLAIVLGIDRFMSECRALTNLIGNGVATIVVSRWENELSKEELRSNLLISKSVADQLEHVVATPAPAATGQST